MTLRLTAYLLVSALAAVVLVAATQGRGGAAEASAAIEKPVVGRNLYRKFCGQCHSLKAARSVGFGSNKKKTGLGTHGGPSFNELRVPYTISVRHVTQPTGGHELLSRKITAKQLHTVAAFVAKVTKTNPIPALSTDG